MKSLLQYHSTISIIIILMVNLPVSGQSQPGFADIDSLTYQQYLQKDWKNLVKTSKEAFSQGIDYYYLRMRTGIAWYERGNYMKALPQFRKALAFNDIDPVAKEYIYYALAWSGRQQDALIFYKNNENALQNKVKEKIRPFRNFSFDLAWHFNFDSNIRSSFNTAALTGMEGYQIVTRRFFNGSFLLKHDLGKRVSLTHGATFLNKYDYYYSQGMSSIFDSYEHITRQLQYYASLAINPGGGFKIMPSIHYINFSSPSLVYRERRFGSMFYVPARRDNYLLGRLSIYKHAWLTDNTLGVSVSDLNGQQQYEADYSLVFYPFGNLNLYVGGTGYGLIEGPLDAYQHKRFAGRGLLGFKVTPEFWIETSALAGEIKNMATDEGFIVYNGNETVTGKYELSLIIPTSEMTFSLRGALVNYYSTFTDSQDVDTNYNKLSFSGLTLIGGLKWNF